MIRPTLDRFTYSGMMIDCSGTISAATTSRKTIPLPRKRSLANANPALVDTIRMITIEATQISSEFGLLADRQLW